MQGPPDFPLKEEEEEDKDEEEEGRKEKKRVCEIVMIFVLRIDY